MSRLSANTRTVVKRNYALITEDSYVGSVMSGWKNVDIRVMINPAMGATISQHLISLKEGADVRDRTEVSQVFYYVFEGSCDITVNNELYSLGQSGFVYIPPGCDYQINGDGAKLISFQKPYVPLDSVPAPKVISGHSNDYKKEMYADDPQLHMQYLLPDEISMDFAVNIFTYHTGGNLPFVEIHVMEHGLFYLQGEGIYRLDDDWYHVKKGDGIWMAPYVPQWFTAMGKEDAVYIYCKDVNRHSIVR